MKRVLSVASARHLLALLGLALAASVGSLSAADHYYVNDHLATTTAVTDAAGEIAAIEADAFGTPVAGAAQAARYTGKPYDDDIGAFVFPFRNYRSDEARWMSADPSGFPDGVNCARYAPNPINDIDPLGLRLDVTVAGGLGGTSSVSQFSFSIKTPAQEITGLPDGQIGGKMEADILFSGDISGWFVQHVIATINGSVGLEYYEASQITTCSRDYFPHQISTGSNGDSLGNPTTDTFSWIFSPPTASGTATIQGWAGFYNPPSEKPSSWDNNIASAKAFYSTDSKPAWFNQSGAAYHYLQIAWKTE